MRRAILSSYISMVAIAVVVNAPPVCLTSIKAELGLTDSQGGALLSALFWGFALTILITGPLADRFGVKPFLLSASLLQIAGLAACSLSRSFGSMISGALLMGMGGGMLEVLVTPLICLLWPGNRTGAVNLCHSFYSSGAVLTVLSASLLLRAGVSWRVVYLAGTLPPILFGAGYLASPLPRTFLLSDGDGPDLRALIGPLFALMLICMLLGGGTELGVAQWIPAYLEEAVGASKLGGAFGLALFSGAMALGRMGMGGISAKIRPLTLLQLLSASCALLIFFSSLARAVPVIALLFGFLGLCVAPFWPTIMAICSERFPGGGATMFTLLSAAGNGGGMIFPALVGLISDRAGLRVGIGTLALLPILLLLTLTALRRRG
ncbi:hypothetical protein DRP77_01490 [Candidatus Poribacteria bacterium]|nr:MAG: hypothetical protein DRP77_01490 [Candidatus Poribacteria bacterium]